MIGNYLDVMFYTEAKEESIIELNQSKTNNQENITGDTLADNNR